MAIKRATVRAVKNIPTPVGKTCDSDCELSCCQKHPHARGEDSNCISLSTKDLETSPRPWGRQLVKNVLKGCSRNIPTPVGKTLSTMCTWPCSGKHPHARGEDRCLGRQQGCALETSPRPWGRLMRYYRATAQERNIPTSVGKTARHACFNVRCEKHPHARGEDPISKQTEAHKSETSPRPWGRRLEKVLRLGRCRNIPTPVGKTYLI